MIQFYYYYWFSLSKYNFNEWKLIKRIPFPAALWLLRKITTVLKNSTVLNGIWWHLFARAYFLCAHACRQHANTFMWLWMFDRTHFYLTIHSIDSIAFICIIYAGIRISPVQPTANYYCRHAFVIEFGYNQIVFTNARREILFALITN